MAALRARRESAISPRWNRFGRHWADNKNLSVNRNALPPGDESGSQSQEAGETFPGLLKTHEELAEPVQPGVGAFDHPAPRLESGLGAFGLGLFAALFEVRTITARPHLLQGRFALVSGIGA